MAPPNVDVPEGRRPIPASSEGPKKTNAQIPVARMVVKPDTAPNPFTHDDSHGGRHRHGRARPHVQQAGAAARLGGTAGSMCRVRTLQDVDEELKRVATGFEDAVCAARKDQPRGRRPDLPVVCRRRGEQCRQRGRVQRVQGPHNRLQRGRAGALPVHERGNAGAVEARSTHTLATIIVGLLEVKDLATNTYAYRLLRFTSAEIARDRVVSTTGYRVGRGDQAGARSGRARPMAKLSGQGAPERSVWTVGGKVLDAARISRRAW